MDYPFLGRGFRPFFFFGAAYAVLSLFLWGGFYHGFVTLPEFIDAPVHWHAHEMLYGFTMAIVAGFLLTAVANWTGGAPARHFHLAALVVIWMCGRLVMNIDLGLSPFVVFSVQLFFIPCLAFSLAIPLIKNWNKRNFVFLFLLTVLFLCDVAFLKTQDVRFLYAATMVIVMMISLIGGRVIPAFTVAALRRRGEEAFQIPQPKMDIAALLSLLSLIILIALEQTETVLMAGAALISLVIHLLRLRHYHTKRILNDPMVWILHLGYCWLMIGLLCFALSAFDIIALSTGFHALTAGAIGTMTLGMMARVALGHTGRELKASPTTTCAFVLMQGAIVLRVFVPMIDASYSIWVIPISAYMWAGCFALYLCVYSPALWQARPDGRPA